MTAAPALELLTGDAQAFRTDSWATRAHLHKTDPDLLAGHLRLQDADQLLTGTAIRTPAVRVARDGAVLPESAYTRHGATLAGKPLTGLVDTRAVLDLFDEGATVVFQGLHRYWPPVADLVAQLELDLGHPCQANAYLTPPGAQGFAVHSDTHDVFVVQTQGRKRWEVHEGDEVREVLLEPGLALYLPTGTPHAARAEDGASLHVTIGINQLTWRGLLRSSVQQALEQVPDTHLPAGYLEDPRQLAHGLAEHLDQLVNNLAGLDAPAVAHHAAERFLGERPARLRGGLVDRLDADAITDRTLLRRRPGHPCRLVDAGDRVRVLLGDRVLDAPARIRPALSEVAGRPELRPADLTMLDPTSRAVLCRRLVREGLLQVAATDQVT